MAFVNVIAPPQIESMTTVGQITFYRRGNVVSFWGDLSGLSTSTVIVYGQLPTGFKPLTNYVIVPVFNSSTAPYMQIGTYMIDQYRMMALRKGSQTTGYVFGTYLTDEAP